MIKLKAVYQDTLSMKIGLSHFEKMLYDNTQFIMLLSKYCKINANDYFKFKLEQTIEFLKKIFLIKEVFRISI